MAVAIVCEVAMSLVRLFWGRGVSHTWTCLPQRQSDWHCPLGESQRPIFEHVVPQASTRAAPGDQVSSESLEYISAVTREYVLQLLPSFVLYYQQPGAVAYWYVLVVRAGFICWGRGMTSRGRLGPGEHTWWTFVGVATFVAPLLTALPC